MFVAACSALPMLLAKRWSVFRRVLCYCSLRRAPKHRPVNSPPSRTLATFPKLAIAASQTFNYAHITPSSFNMEKRSPRRMTFDEPNVASNILNMTKSPPDPNSLSWRMWGKCLDIADLALNSKYMQGIAKGDLDPNNYGSYTVQDCGYCYHAAGTYKKIGERAAKEGLPEVSSFSKARFESYGRYNVTLRKQWHISQQPGALQLGEAAQRYIDFEDAVAEKLSPIYGVIMMIPCDQLWPYMAGKLKEDATDGNLYRFWIIENDDWHGAYRLDNFINEWAKKHPSEFDEEVAYKIYRTAMVCELNFFRSACGEELLPMPTMSF